MRNEKTKTAGLYHYPAMSIKDARIQQDILSMLNDIKPSHIFVTSPKAFAYGVASYGASHVFDDLDEVKAFLKKHLVSAEITYHNNIFANYFAHKGKFIINRDHEADKYRLPATPKGAPTARKFTVGDATFSGCPPKPEVS